MTADSLTVLTCVPGHRCAKAYTNGADEKPDPYDAGFLFSVESVPVANLDELADALDTLRSDPQAMVIRDQLRADAKPAPNGLYPRRRVDRPGDPAPFEHAEHYWACLDADATATAFDPADAQGSVERWRSSLPTCLQGAAMVFQFSASQHRSETVRGHAWIWLAEPMGNVPLARWCNRNGIDPALFHAVQPHYTADPVFPAGVSDPLAPRWLVRLAGSEAVELDFTAEDIEASTTPGQAGGMRLGAIALEEVGDPSEAGAEFRAMVAKQLQPSFAKAGKRWDLCGHVGGACANAGVPPEECCAILEELRAGDVADRDFGQGLSWALGAYTFTGKPLGLKGIRELTTPIVAIKVGDALGMLARALEPPTPEEAEALARPWGSLPLEDFDYDAEPEPIKYICEGLQIGPGKPTGIVAYANNSKTPYALELAVHVALPFMQGKQFHGHTIERPGTKTLVVVTEGARNARRKLSKICAGQGLEYKALRGKLKITQGPPGFLTVEAAAELGELAIAQGYGLVVIDTYNSAFDGSKDRNTNDFSQALKVLGDISDRSDITFVVLLHTRKGDAKMRNRMPVLQDIDGHNSIAGALQSAIGLWRLDDSNKQRIGVCCIREVDAPFDTYVIDWTDTDEGAGLRAELVENQSDAGTALAEQAAERQRNEVEATAFVLAMIDAGDFAGATQYAIDRAPLAAFGLPKRGDSRALFMGKLVREGVVVRKHANGSVQYHRPPRSPASVEALAKRTGFLDVGVKPTTKAEKKS